MELTKKDRWILCNQYLILEKLYPEQAADFAKVRNVLENGYALDYGWVSEYILDDFSVSGCREVLDVLDMHWALQISYEALEDNGGIDENRLRFHGFDGNDETGHMAYAKHLVEDEQKFSGLQIKGFNSHCPTLDRYRSMLTEWENSSEKYELTKGDIIRIIHAR
jgi:uncharacterized protein YfbU (UPF0304 family)